MCNYIDFHFFHMCSQMSLCPPCSCLTHAQSTWSTRPEHTTTSIHQAPLRLGSLNHQLSSNYPPYSQMYPLLSLRDIVVVQLNKDLAKYYSVPASSPGLLRAGGGERREDLGSRLTVHEPCSCPSYIAQNSFMTLKILTLYI